MEQILIKHFDLANEKIIKRGHLFVVLADEYFKYSAEYYSEVPKASDPDDHSMGWEERYNKFVIKLKKESIVAVEMRWLDKRECWSVELESNGYPNTISIFFELESEAEEFHHKIDTYVFGNQ